MHTNKLGFFLLTTVVLAAVLGGWFGGPLSATPSGEDGAQDVLRTFTSVLAALQESYVEPVSTEEMVEEAVRGMLRTLDPHSSFFSTSDYNRLQEEQRGKYYGLGITIRAESPGSGRVYVVEPPSPGTPAYKVGLKAGDVIAKIEGQPIDTWDLNEDVIPNLKGPKGTKVNITVERPGEEEPIEMAVIRDEISLYTIKYTFHIADRIGYVRINRFSETTGSELEEALEELKEQDLQGLILDLRDNPGGALSQALAVSDRFLEKGQLIVSTRGRNTDGREFRARKGSEYDYPMVVLINRNSASASEIVSGALQDHDRALIVGETSFGKALVQTIFPLEGNRGLALTTGRYYTPSDRLIQRDYSGSFYQYYYNRADEDGEGGAEHQTDSGRAVYGGGGIAPDEKVSMKRFSSLVRGIDRKRLFVDFIGRLTEGEIESDIRYQYRLRDVDALPKEEREQLLGQLTITERTIQLFKSFLTEHDFQFTEEDFEKDRIPISNRLRQELVYSLFGDVEGFRIALESDDQVQRGLELLPRAAALIQNQVASQ